MVIMGGLLIYIAALTPKRIGEEAELEINIEREIPSGDDPSVMTLRRETRRLTVSAKMLFDIGNIGVNVLPYKLTREQFDILEYDEKLWEAVKKGYDLLSYGDNTERRLVGKLRERGFDQYVAEDAAAYIVKEGGIDEADQLERFVTSLAEKKHYGPSRIRQEVMRHGFSRDVVSERLSELLDGIDFYEQLMYMLRRKCDISMLDDMKYRQKLYAAMMRQGYGFSDTKDAIADLISEENNENE